MRHLHINLKVVFFFAKMAKTREYSVLERARIVEMKTQGKITVWFIFMDFV